MAHSTEDSSEEHARSVVTRVDYNEETNRLDLPPGLIIGKDINKHRR